jgi:hypothetical protein
MPLVRASEFSKSTGVERAQKLREKGFHRERVSLKRTGVDMKKFSLRPCSGGREKTSRNILRA